jgi:hypothetical protein
MRRRPTRSIGRRCNVNTPDEPDTPDEDGPDTDHESDENA